MSAPYCVSSVEYLPVSPMRTGLAAVSTGEWVMPLSDLLQATAETRALIAGLKGRDATVTSLSMDSRDVTPGSLFFALAGSGEHGLEYLDQALARGATAVLWDVVDEVDWAAFVAARCRDVVALPVRNLRALLGDLADRFYAMPSAKMQVFAVTGTDGKTSVAHLVARALDDDESRCGLIGTLGNGFTDALETATRTTPDVLTTHRLLAALQARGAKKLIMEASSHGLDQGRVDAVRFSIAVLTNLSRDHLDYHGSVEAYADAKRKLFIRPELKTAIINSDDAFGVRLLQDAQVTAHTIAYGRKRSADADDNLIIDSVTTHDLGLDVVLSGSFIKDADSVSIQSHLLGDFNADNLAAAFAVMVCSGVSAQQAAARLSASTAVPGRMEAFASDGALLVVDFAHTPAALEQALQTLRAHCSGKLFCVFGCGGDRDRGKRPLMGEIAERHADVLIVTDDNPRTEDPDQIVAEILTGLSRPDRATVQRDRAMAIRQAVNASVAGDLVLVAGKGHEEYQQIGERRFYFSDRDLVAQLAGQIRTQTSGKAER